jgi:hypothetical protein
MSQNFQVNWVNGMKITSGHFIELENHVIQRMQNSFRGVVNNLSYGLVPGGELEENIPQFSISFSENKIRPLHAINAITPDGYLIQLPANLEFSIAKPLAEAAAYYLVISIKPFERVPYGLINEEESPLRFPSVIPEYQFSLIPQNINTLHILGNCMVPVGKYSGTTFNEEKSFIPPCTSIQAHPALLELYNTLHITFNDLEKKILELLGKQNISNRMMLVNLISFFNENKTAFEWYMPFQPPVFLIETITKIARIIYFSSEIQNMPIKEDLKVLLQGLISFEYNHLEIGKAVANARSFTDNYLRFLPKSDNVFGV